MKHKRNWAIGIILSATAAFFALQNVAAPTPDDTIPPSSAVTSETPPPATESLTPTFEGCGYMWAYHDDPELSARINEAVQQLDSTASANVQLFGEDCVYADGRSTFSVMETDFYVRLPAEDLTAENFLGNFMKQFMDVITDLPDDEIQGRKGFVEFSFIKNDAERIIFRVDINDYSANAAGLTGMEIFQRYHTPTP